MATKSFMTHLESPLDGSRFPVSLDRTTHEGRPLRVAYDLDAVGEAVQPESLQHRRPDMWRYAELLPLATGVVSLGEVMTPLLRCPRLGAELGLSNLYIKDESQLPTGSFKARGMAMAITMARAFGIDRVALPSAGNAGGAAAAYAARAGMECFVFMPADAPEINRAEAALFGARVFLVDGLIGDCGAIVAKGRERMGWFDLSTMREPFRLEGKKTMGLELAEQFEWDLPDVICYPTGGGTGLIGMWKAFQELGQLGWLEHESLPRMYACQSSGCAPLVEAFASGARHATPPENPATVAAGLRVPSCIADFMILDIVRASRGLAVAAEEARLVEQMQRASELEGISICPEAAVCVDALESAVKEGHIQPDERVVIFNTGAAQKYIEILRRELPRLEPGAVDWDRISD